MENCTDLAVESYENGGKTVLDGVKVEENGKITTVTVFNKKGGRKKKPQKERKRGFGALMKKKKKIKKKKNLHFPL